MYVCGGKTSVSKSELFDEMSQNPLKFRYHQIDNTFITIGAGDANQYTGQGFLILKFIEINNKITYQISLQFNVPDNTNQCSGHSPTTLEAKQPML